MVKLFLKSSGVPQSYIDLYDRFEAEGFDAFGKKAAAADDPNWSKFAGGEGNRTGLWLFAKSPTSRVAIGIFLEGVNDEILEGLVSDGGAALPALPAVATTT
jgi:hypothetical protein